MDSIKLTDIAFDDLSLEELDALIFDLDTASGENRELVSMLIDIATSLHQENEEAKRLEQMAEVASWEIDSLEWTDLDELDRLVETYTDKQDSKEFWELCEDFRESDPTTYYVVQKELAKQAIKDRVRRNPLHALVCPISALF